MAQLVKAVAPSMGYFAGCRVHRTQEQESRRMHQGRSQSHPSWVAQSAGTPGRGAAHAGPSQSQLAPRLPPQTGVQCLCSTMVACKAECFAPWTFVNLKVLHPTRENFRAVWLKHNVCDQLNVILLLHGRIRKAYYFAPLQGFWVKEHSQGITAR